MNQKYFNAFMARLDRIEMLLNGLYLSRPEEEVLLDSYDMCRLLNISQSTLLKLRREGTIPCNKIGRKYYYPKSFFTQEFLNTIVKVEDPSKRFDD